MMMYGLANPK